MLIELRLRPGQYKLSRMSHDVASHCFLPGALTHRVPHMSLYTIPPTDARTVHRIISALEAACSPYRYLPYTVDGFQRLKSEQGEVVYLRIVPSAELVDFRVELAGRLRSICPSTKTYERQEGFLFHITVAYKLSRDQCERVWSYVDSGTSAAKSPRWYSRVSEFFRALLGSATRMDECPSTQPYLPLDALRVTLLADNQHILREYDLGSQRLLNRSQALDRHTWQATLRNYRISRGMEVESEGADGDTFLISDLHLHHANIIDYCARPFASVDDMNRTLVANWCKTVRDKRIYFLGDLSFGRGARPATYWLPILSGQKRYIRGNHESSVPESVPMDELNYGGQRFVLIHDPRGLPETYRNRDGWLIHGHTHNNNLRDYPFINGVNRTINVSAEVVNYCPVSIEHLVSLGLDRIKRMDTVDSQPEYW